LAEAHEFFDPRDLVQVRYEMLRRVDVDGQPVARTADTFGVSRPTFYQTQAAFTQQGFAGLVPRKRGPHGAHKLDDAVMAFVTALRAADPTLSVRALLPRIHERFGLAVHPRSLERALKRWKKTAVNGRAVVAAASEVPSAILVTSYEALRRVALGRGGPEGPSLGFAVLLRHGMRAWLQAWATATECLCCSSVSTATPIAEMKPKSSRPTAVTTCCWHLPRPSSLR
jgi:transposase